jgi:hypothetical protein
VCEVGRSAEPRRSGNHASRYAPSIIGGSEVVIPRVKRLVKRVLTSVAPQMTTAVLSARARAHSHRLYRAWALLDLNRKLVEHFGSTVKDGPFRGMTLSPMTHQEHLGPFLLGTYEAELHPWLETIAAKQFSQILDVGAKFGYYAVGLSRLFPGTPVIAFDTDRWARAATREMATVNRTPDVSPAGFCSPGWLDRHLQPLSFILSDCEGFEGELFSQTSTPSLDSATLLIEMHDYLVPGVGAAVRERFARTHTLATVTSGGGRYPSTDLSFLSPSEAATAVNEYRPQQEWLLLTPYCRYPGGNP